MVGRADYYKKNTWVHLTPAVKSLSSVIVKIQEIYSDSSCKNQIISMYEITRRKNDGVTRGS